jgi:hypothetical protein
MCTHVVPGCDICIVQVMAHLLRVRRSHPASIAWITIVHSYEKFKQTVHVIGEHLSFIQPFGKFYSNAMAEYESTLSTN